MQCPVCQGNEFAFCVEWKIPVFEILEDKMIYSDIWVILKYSNTTEHTYLPSKQQSFILTDPETLEKERKYPEASFDLCTKCMTAFT